MFGDLRLNDAVRVIERNLISVRMNVKLSRAPNWLRSWLQKQVQTGNRGPQSWQLSISWSF